MGPKLKILITGPSGFIGQHVISELSDQHQLIGITSSEYTDPALSQMFSWHDLTDLPEVDVCIHLAGLAHDMSGRHSDDDYVKINFELTRELLQSLNGKCKKFIYLSSIKAVCEMGCRDLKENAAYAPSSPYGLSKQMAEEYILENSEQLGLIPYVFRPVMIYGPGSKGNLNSLIRFIRTGTPYPFRSYQNEKSILYIKNLTHCIRQFIENDPDGGVYHVADREKLSTKDISKLIASAMNIRFRQWDAPSILYRRFLRSKNGRISRMFQKLLGDLSVNTDKLNSVLTEELPYTSEEAFHSFLHK